MDKFFEDWRLERELFFKKGKYGIIACFAILAIAGGDYAIRSYYSNININDQVGKRKEAESRIEQIIHKAAGFDKILNFEEKTQMLRDLGYQGIITPQTHLGATTSTSIPSYYHRDKNESIVYVYDPSFRSAVRIQPDKIFHFLQN